jgi:hypothetical protein
MEKNLVKGDPPCKGKGHVSKAEWSHTRHLVLWLKCNPGGPLEQFNAELAATYREHVNLVKAHTKEQA